MGPDDSRPTSRPWKPVSPEPGSTNPDDAPRSGPAWEPVPRYAPGGDGGAPHGPSYSDGPQDPPLPAGARKARGTLGWDIMLGVDLAVVAFSVVLGIGIYLFFVTTGTDLLEPATQPSETAQQVTLFLSILANLFLFGIIPLAWVVGTRTGGWAGVRSYLHLHDPASSWRGIPLAVALVVVVGGAAVLVDALGWSEETPNMEALLGGLNWPLVFFISFVAATSEELLFRGILQKWFGWVGQGVVFGLFHLGNGVTALVATGLIGLLFGYLVKRGQSLWVVVTAHFVYDVILLSLALLAPELG